MINGIALIHFNIIIFGAIAEFVYDNLFEYTSNLTAVYKDPGHVFGEDLLRTTVFYLDELMELEEALDDPKEEKAITTLNAIYKEGGPKHTNNVPYQQFIDTYNWTETEIEAMASYVSKTCATWDRLLLKVNDLIKCDIKEYTEKILNIYKEPTSSSTEKLIMYAFFYLDEMFKLEEEIEMGNEECKEFLKRFYADGGPKHIDNIPWGKFMEDLKWTGTDVSEYENVINKTKQSWSDLKKAVTSTMDH